MDLFTKGFELEGVFLKLLFLFGFWNDDLQAPPQPADLDAWVHYAAVFDAATLEQRIYREGVLVAQRTATAAYLNIMTPRLFKRLTGTRSIRTLVGRTLEYVLMMVLAADSEEELRYQSRVLKAIVSDSGGFAMDMGGMKPFVRMALMGFVRATLPALVFRIGGSFNTALDRNDALDTQENWRDACLKVKEEWIGKGGILDDMGDNPYYVPYENNMWAHCEVVYQYDPRDPKHREALEPIFLDVTIAAIEHCMEPLFTSDPRVRKLISPLAGNFSKYQQAISRGLDPKQAADNTLYSVEADFDFSGIDPDRVKRLVEVAEQRRWQ